MTLLKVYNKNGHCRQPEAPAYGLTGLLNDFPFRDYYTSGAGYRSPRVNIKETEDSYAVELEVPGIDKNLLKIETLKDMLTISYQEGETRNDEKFTRREFNFRNFERSFRIPESVDKEKISGKYNDGILVVTLVKKEEAIDKGPRTIEIL